MTDVFHTHIRASLANPVLQAALDGNAERRTIGRKQAFESLPDANILRQRAHSVRADVIANLDQYLTTFTSRLQDNGIIVHQAEDAGRAVQIVLDIVRENGAKLIAKSKTMVSEEIHLNHALEEAGLKVVETDLGEFIIQLRNEHPSHIITPAAHLLRHEVGQTFHEKLGIPYTEDIPTMTAAARSTLRQVFLEADIGLSGVNFGVAQTGTLCIVTNEGNGRMVTTIPPVHIALMGIERLVPTPADLVLMLSLLPRSATGQKLSVYTSLIHSPRQGGEADGPRERHLILLDNGRRNIRHSPLAEVLYCIRCGACLNICPVFREIGGHAYVNDRGEGATYPGPIGSVLSPALFGGDEFGHLARASSLCGACKEACPVDIDLPRLLLRVRAGFTPPDPKGAEKPGQANSLQVPAYLHLGLKLFTWFATTPFLFKAAQYVAGFASRILSPRSGWMRLPAFTGWGYSKDFPRPALRPFHAQFKPTPVIPPPESPSGETATACEAQPPGNQAEQAIQPTAPSLESMTERFSHELRALGGRVISCEENELGTHILGIIRERQASKVFTWKGSHLPGDLLDSLAAQGVLVTHGPDPEASIGITGCMAAIAESGSLVMRSAAGQPLSASLLPETHIAILRKETIFETLSQALASWGQPGLQNTSAAVLITGPSRTADIEMTLTIGVHGPKEVIVFCI